MKIGDEYTCAKCDETYLCVWDDDYAQAEADCNGFSDVPESDMVTVCDNCYKSMGFVPIVRH